MAIHYATLIQIKKSGSKFIHLIDHSAAMAFADQGQTEISMSIGGDESSDIRVFDDSEIGDNNVRIYAGIFSPYFLVMNLGKGVWVDGKPLKTGKKINLKHGQKFTFGPFGLTQYKLCRLEYGYGSADSDADSDVGRSIDEPEPEGFEGLRSLFIKETADDQAEEKTEM